MPTLQSMNIPKPQNWQDFESIVRDAMSQKWKSSTLAKNGRPGQRQQGVDIYGPDDLGRATGIQCKKFSGALSLSTIEDEIGKAAKFKGNLTTLFIATTSDHDSKLQEQVRVLSEHRAARNKFTVGVLFWEDIVAGLVMNPSVFSNHYPQLNVSGNSQTDAPNETLIGALELGYLGGALTNDIELIFGEFGFFAQEDPDQFFVVMRILERRASQLLAPDDAQEIILSLRSIAKLLKSGAPNWNTVNLYAKRATNRITGAASLLPFAESNYLELGVALKSLCDQTEDIDKPIRQRMKRRVRALLKCKKTLVNEAFKAARINKRGYRWAPKIFSFVDRELRMS